MKKILVSICFSFTAILLVAQTNNPYKQRGEDLVSSLGIIRADPGFNLSNGFDQATIDKYRAMIPTKSSMTESLAGEIVSTIKGPGFNFEKFIRESPLSVFSQDILLGIFNSAGKNIKTFSQKITEAVDAVNANVDLESGEKELVLTLLSFAYQLHETPVAVMDRRNKTNPCYVTTANGTEPIDCWVFGAMAGGVIGWYICGAWCAIGGAIIGGIAGALS
ncbi:MAG: hypothetical protein V4722_28340 [Bacteroidota bacterium]